MKRQLLKVMVASSVFLTSFAAAAACAIPAFRTPLMDKVIDKFGGIPLSELQCAQIKENNLRLYLVGHGGVTKTAAVGWVIVSVMDLDTERMSLDYSVDTKVSSEVVNMETVDKLVYLALKKALKDFDIGNAAAALKARQGTSNK